MLNARLVTVGAALSHQRLANYAPEDTAGATHQEIASQALARYLWNVSLAEATYPVLHSVEIALRNGLHEAIMLLAGTPTWFEHPTLLCDEERPQIAEAQLRLTKAGKDPHDPGRVVAELMFGFWIALLARRYADPGTTAPRRLWPDLLERAFPNISAGLRRGETRGIAQLRSRFYLVGLLRNRVSHHEPVWRGIRLDEGRVVTLPELHSQTLEALTWLSPDLATVCRSVSRLEAIYQAGAQPYIDVVSQLFPLPGTPGE